MFCFYPVAVFVPCVLPLGCLRLSILGREKNRNTSSYYQLCCLLVGLPGFLQVSSGVTLVPLWGGPWSACLCGWLVSLEESHARKRGIQAGGEGVSGKPPCPPVHKETGVSWMGFCGSRLNSKWKVGEEKKTVPPPQFPPSVLGVGAE